MKFKQLIPKEGTHGFIYRLIFVKSARAAIRQERCRHADGHWKF